MRVDPVLPVGDLDPVEHVRLARLIGELHPAVVDLGVAALVFVVVEFVVKLVRPGPAGVLRRGGGLLRVRLEDGLLLRLLLPGHDRVLFIAHT